MKVLRNIAEGAVYRARKCAAEVSASLEHQTPGE
jgi:hypothetical protein